MKEIKVVIDEKGRVQIEVSGIRGKECLKETEALERALGLADGERKLKSEYYVQAQQAQVRGR